MFYATFSFAEGSFNKPQSENPHYITDILNLGVIESAITDLNFDDGLDLSLDFAITYYHNVGIGSYKREDASEDYLSKYCHGLSRREK